MSTRSPGASPVKRNESSAETNALGTVASPDTEIPSGAGATNSSCVIISCAKAPKPRPTTWSPTEAEETSAPTATT